MRHSPTATRITPKKSPTCTYLAQGDGASSQANESPFPAVGMLGERKLLREDLDDVFDLRRVVLSHKLSHQPGERRGKRPGGFRFCAIQKTRGLGSPQPSETLSISDFWPQQMPEKAVPKLGTVTEPTRETRALPSSPLTSNSSSLPSSSLQHPS